MSTVAAHIVGANSSTATTLAAVDTAMKTNVIDASNTTTYTTVATAETASEESVTDVWPMPQPRLLLLPAPLTKVRAASKIQTLPMLKTLLLPQQL